MPTAGWYPDPQTGQQRYWNGRRWENPGRPDKWLLSGVIWGVLFPLLGLVFAIVLFAKNRPSHGAAVLVACVVGFLIVTAFLF